MFKNIKIWFNERLPDRGSGGLLNKQVPHYATGISYGMGGLALVAFWLLVMTGIFLAFFYVPHADRAYRSVWFLSNEVRLGWLARSLHYWAAQALVLLALLHLFRVFINRAYSKPGELTWITGVVQLNVIIALAVSGFLLPWHDNAYAVASILIKNIGAFPLIGSIVKGYFITDGVITPFAPLYFYALHIALLPLIFGLLLAVHFWLVRKKNIA